MHMHNSISLYGKNTSKNHVKIPPKIMYELSVRVAIAASEDDYID